MVRIASASSPHSATQLTSLRSTLLEQLRAASDFARTRTPYGLLGPHRLRGRGAFSMLLLHIWFWRYDPHPSSRRDTHCCTMAANFQIYSAQKVSFPKQVLIQKIPTRTVERAARPLSADTEVPELTTRRTVGQ